MLSKVMASIGLFNWLVNFFAFHPQPGNQVDPHFIDPTVQEIFFVSSDGIKLQAFYIPRPESNRVVLFLHGNAGNASHRLGDAVQLANLGTNVFLLSYRGYGKSEGEPSEDGLYLDGRSALQYIQLQMEFPLNRTIILGRSIGAAVAIDMAQDYPLAGLVLVAPFSSGRDFATAQGLGWLAWLTGEPFYSIGKIQQVTTPMLFIHGAQDNIVPMELGRKLFEQSPSPKSWKTIPQAGHNDLTQRAGLQYWRWIQEFMDKVTSS